MDSTLRPRRQLTSTIAWQGWRISPPPSWNPIRLDGDFAKGSLMLADMSRPRLGIRWQLAKAKKLDLQKLVESAMRDEVGQLAAAEAKPFPLDAEMWPASLLYLDPDPPGRDVWIGFSSTSNRLLQIVYHSQKRERLLAESILPTVCDEGAAGGAWSIFELSCRVPDGYSLKSHHLMAGDLSLTFSRQRLLITIRQVAVAQLALQRMPIEKWLASQQRLSQKHYRAIGTTESFAIVGPNCELHGVKRSSVRRRRFFFKRLLPTPLITCAVHDRLRDRLVILESSNEQLLQSVATTIGWAARSQED